MMLLLTVLMVASPTRRSNFARRLFRSDAPNCVFRGAFSVAEASRIAHGDEDFQISQ
jgi:hypothetical protein